MRTILILNPTSGSSAMATHQSTPEENEEHILASLRMYDIEPEILYTTPEDAGKGLAQQAAADGADLVIAAGGDGTLHSVASGLINTHSTLGIIPMGTMNNIARSLKIPEEVAGACAVIARGETSQMDVGHVNDHVFLEVAGVGLEAALFPAAEEIKRSGFMSTVHGIIRGLRTLFAFQPTKFAVSFDGHRARRFRAVQISICNSPYYGARLQFAPNALMDDGFLDVLIYKNFSKLEYLRHAASISQGRRALNTKVTRRKVKSIHIRSETPVELHADGVSKGYTPVVAAVQPGASQVRVPEKTAKGPNVSKPAQKNTRRYQEAHDQHNTLAEKGPLHVQ